METILTIQAYLQASIAKVAMLGMITLSAFNIA